MTPLETVLSAWIAFHAELGVDIEAFLLPPATEAQIVEVEEKIGYRLPEDLRELYKIANGQWNMFDDNSDLIDVDNNQRWAPLFGNYDFMPLEKALRQYEFYLDSYTSEKDFNAKYYKANPDKTYEPTVWEVRIGDAVDEAGWNPNWFTFAGSDANSLSVDMAPPRGGSPGQVVLHGADEWVLQVAGHSVTDLMKQAITHITVVDEHRYQYSEKHDRYMASVYFNMDWRAELYIPQEPSDKVTAPPAWMDEHEQVQERRREQLDVWLQDRGMADDDRKSLIQWIDIELLRRHEAIPLMNNQAEMQRKTGGEMPDLSVWPDATSTLMLADSRSSTLQHHVVNMVTAYLQRNFIESPIGPNLSIEKAIEIYHQFKYESGEWTQEELQKIQKIEAEFQNLPINIESGYNMTREASTLTICTFTFDEETYKSGEICHELEFGGI